MATYKRNDIDKMLKAAGQGKVSNLYLLVGDRYLCSQVADRLISQLVPDQAARQPVSLIDGNHEDPVKTLASLKTYSLFPGKQITRVSDTRLFHSKAVAQAITKPPEINSLNDPVTSPEGSVESQAPEKDPADLFREAFEAGIPENNILILLAEAADKRKKLYKFIDKNGVVADLSVEGGSSKAARTDQEAVLRSLISETLTEFGKQIEPQAVTVLLERVGFHPVAVVRETEKLALYAGENPVVTLQSVREIVGRTREDALFELTEAYSEQQLIKALVITQRLFNDGVHPLVLVSGLRNHLKKLLLVRSIQESEPPSYVPNMSYAVFQKGYLPELKVAKEEWIGLLPVHPYALFMMFNKAGQNSIASLAEKLAELLKVEHCLKSSSVSPQIFFERFLWKSLTVK
nr:DNA polymerase III subunit delta [Desulfobulbaceae bacterium]